MDHFAQLAQFVEEDDPDKIINKCQEILARNPSDKDALRMLAIAQMQSSDFEGASKTLAKSSSSTPFERAYCMYRKYDIEGSLHELKEEEEGEAKSNLLAQNNYRLGFFDRAVEIYERQFASAEGAEMDGEQQTNVLAAYANAGSPIKALKFVSRLSTNTEITHELAYNVACVLIDCGQLKKASAKLEQAMKLCRRTLEEEGADEQTIKEELAVIRVQKAYILQVQGKNEQAMAVYVDVLNDKPDEAVLAVCCNNIISLRRKDEKLFDSLKKSGRAAAVTQWKLTVRQRRAVSLNRCLLHLYGHKGDKCREEVSKLQAEMPSSEFPVLVLASHYYREKKMDKCDAVLDEHIAKYPNNCTQAKLTKAQLLLLQGKAQEATQALLALDAALRFRPAVVASIVALSLKVKDVAGASQVLSASVQYWGSAEEEAGLPKETIRKFARVLMTASAHFHLQRGLYPQAATLFETLAKQATTAEERGQFTAHLVKALAPVDPDKAALHARKLPGIESEHIDVDELESITRVRSDLKRRAKGASAMEEGGDKEGGAEARKKRKKKRKPRYPKGFDPANPGPPPDPERWLPRWERSNAKKIRKRGANKGIARGPQGGPSSGDVSKLDASQFEEVTAVTQKSAKSSTSAAQRAQNRKGKKKRR